MANETNMRETPESTPAPPRYILKSAIMMAPMREGTNPKVIAETPAIIERESNCTPCSMTSGLNMKRIPKSPITKPIRGVWENSLEWSLKG